MATRTRRRRTRYQLRPTWLTAKRTIAVIVLAAVLVFGVYGVRTAMALGKVFHTNPVTAIVNLVQGKGGSTIETDKVKNLNRINIALYGYGGPGHDGPYLTDSIMVVSIQPQRDAAPRIAEISIPRDWYVPIVNSNGQRIDRSRINQAYSDGMGGIGTVPQGQPAAGASVADPTLSALLGIHIDYFIGVDFDAFLSAVDAVGGVDVNVATSFVDYEYPAGECGGRNSNCGFKTVRFTQGLQHMDGQTALIFARSRHGTNGEGSDFGRSKRQQLILLGVKQKLLSVGGIGQLPGLLSALGDHVLTNLSINDAQAMYDLVRNIDSATIEHISLDDQNFLYECGYPGDCGAAYIYAHDGSFATLGHFIQNVFADPAALAEHATVGIQDASGRGQGAATRWAAILGQLGWTTDDQGPVRRSATTQVIDQSGGRATAAAKWFAAYFGVTVQTVAPPTPGANGPGDGVIVILGQDEENAFNNHPGYGG